jgi:hypothetical protein
MRSATLALLLALPAAAAECPPSRPAIPMGLEPGLRGWNFDLTLALPPTDLATRATIAARLKARVATAGGALARVDLTPAGLHVGGWLDGGAPHLAKLLRPGVFSIHPVDEERMRAVTGATLPEGVRVERDGERMQVFCRDCAKLRAAFPVPDRTWLTTAPKDGESEAFLVGPAEVVADHVDRCRVKPDEEPPPVGPAVELALTAEGTNHFAEITFGRAERRNAIAIDDEVIEAPRTAWGGRPDPAHGMFLHLRLDGGDAQAIRELAAILRHGPLPDGLRLAP